MVRSKKQPPYETYAVSLGFDDAASENIRALVDALCGATGNAVLADRAVPAHMTLGMFHAPAADEERLCAAARAFAEDVSRAFTVSFVRVAAFLDKVLFLSVGEGTESFSRLSDLNARLHESFFCGVAPGGNGNYRAGRFVPHVALALKLNREQFERGSAAVCAEDGLFARAVPLRAVVTSVSLQSLRPRRELARFGLSSDRLTPSQRHAVMSRIRSTGGAPETSLRSQLFRFGFRFRKNDRRLRGSPDIVFARYRAVVFVNGCFWHAHGWKSAESALRPPILGEGVLYSLSCGAFRMPRTNRAFWDAKFARNRARDLRDVEELLAGGWRVGVVWECSITGKNRAEKIRSVAESISFWLEEEHSVLFREF